MAGIDPTYVIIFKDQDWSLNLLGDAWRVQESIERRYIMGKLKKKKKMPGNVNTFSPRDWALEQKGQQAQKKRGVLFLSIC